MLPLTHPRIARRCPPLESFPANNQALTNAQAVSVKRSFRLAAVFGLLAAILVHDGRSFRDSLATAAALGGRRPPFYPRKNAGRNEERSKEKLIALRSRYHPQGAMALPATAEPAPFRPLRRSDVLRPAGETMPRPAPSKGFAQGIPSGINDTVQQQWLASYAAGSAASDDEAVSIARDGTGNLYVTGFSDSSGTGDDILTIKYSSGGTQLWSARYDGPAHGDDRPAKIVVDSSGNAYVTGRSAGAGSGYDFVTIKYSSGGAQLWSARYNGPANGDDAATGAALDGLGSVYVTGYSLGSGSGYDYATVQYSSSGAQQKVFRYNGAGNGNDVPAAIAADKANAVYVTGYTATAGSGKDITTVKYDANGNQRWAVSFNGTGNGDDYPAGLAIDNGANVYVTGTTAGSGSGDDFATMKYDSAGAQKWVLTYNGPGNDVDRPSAIVVDASGNPVVAGSSRGAGTGFDYAVIKYTAAGTLSWLERYDGVFGGDDFASAVAVDPSGFVYVTGSSSDATTVLFNEVTVMYNSSGFQQWSSRYKASQSNDSYPTAIVNDGSGGVTVAGYSDLEGGAGFDYSTVTYAFTGSQVWEKRYDGPGISDDAATAVASDKSGNIYVAGYSRSSVTGYDFLTVKYDASGVLQWASRYDGPSSGDDIVSALATDAAGNVFVTGYSYDSSGSTSEYATVKYNAAGAQIWVARNSGLLESYNFAFDLAVSNTGDVFVTGTAGDSSGSAYDYLTLKYNAGGSEQWSARYSGSGNGGDFANAIAVDSSGNVYVTGASDESSARGYDYGTVKYSAGGGKLWTAKYNGTGSDDDDAIGIAVDGTGNVVVTGSSIGPITSYDYATVRYNSAGSQLWAKRFNGTANDDDTPSSMALDASGNVYVTGYTTSMGTGTDYATLRYSAGGVQQWASLYNGPVSGADQATGIAVDLSGNAVVTGFSGGTGTMHDFATVKYDSLGNQKWSARFDGSASGQDEATGIVLEPGGDAVVGGYSGFGLSGDPSSGNVFVAIRYHSLSGAVLTISISPGTGWQLISLPVRTASPYVLDHLFAYEGGYVTHDTMVNGKGYWKKLTDPNLSFTGLAIDADTLEVSAQWNIIGSVSGPVPVHSITSSPPGIIASPFFGYNGSYFVADTIAPGHAYWVRTSGPGGLYLQSPQAVPGVEIGR